MYGHRDQSYSGDRRERHQHSRGSSSHSSRDRNRKQGDSRKDRDHGSHRSGSRRISGGGGESESGSSSKRSASGASGSGRRSSRDDRSHHSTTSDRSKERFSRASRSSASRSSSIDDLLGSHAGKNSDLPADGGTSSKKSKKTEESGSSSVGFGGFILHEAISPPSDDFDGGSFRAGGFEICMPVTRSSSNDSATIIGHKRRRAEDLWGAVVQLGATPPDASPPRVPLWQKDWKPGPLTCSVPKFSETSPVVNSSKELSDRSASVLNLPRDGHGRNMLLHAIDMQHYIRETRKLLTSLQDDQERDIDGPEGVPEKSSRFYHSTSTGSKMLSCDEVQRLPAVRLSQHGLSQLLKRSTAAISSFCGYEWSSPEALSILSDVTGKFLENFTQLFCVNANRSSNSDGYCFGFRDALERSLHESGFNGKEGLWRYWKEEVEGQARLLDAEADEIRNECLQMTVTEEFSGSTRPPVLSSPFSRSQLFHDEDKTVESVEEEMPLEAALKERRTELQVVNFHNGQPGPFSPLPSPELRPPDYFAPLELEPKKKVANITNSEL